MVNYYKVYIGSVIVYLTSSLKLKPYVCFMDLFIYIHSLY